MTINSFIPFLYIISLIVFLFFFFFLEKEEIINWLQDKKRKKYRNSDLYIFQKTKVKNRMIEHYKAIGYWNPSFMVNKKLQELEEADKIEEVYKAYKEYNNV
jgi:hypothetical protein